MTVDELAEIRCRWHPEAANARTPQDYADFVRVFAELELAVAQHLVCLDFLSQVVECDRPLPAGLQAQAAAILAAQAGGQPSPPPDARPAGSAA